MEQNTKILQAISEFILCFGYNMPPYEINGYFGFADVTLKFSDKIEVYSFFFDGLEVQRKLLSTTNID